MRTILIYVKHYFLPPCVLAKSVVLISSQIRVLSLEMLSNLAFPVRVESYCYKLDCLRFPFIIMQEILNDVTNIDLVVNLKLPENVLLEKCLGRRICSECGKNFNVATINVKGENGNPDINMDPLLPPPQCASKLITRSDDTETIVKERLRIYSEKVLSFFPLTSSMHLPSPYYPSLNSIWNCW